jgi:hypothetical protein
MTFAAAFKWQRGSTGELTLLTHLAIPPKKNSRGMAHSAGLITAQIHPRATNLFQLLMDRS